jgi:CsoR family transcriptional regulator, copper-sensing transcriptional repressor
MLTKEMQQSMTARLNRVEGQLRGIRRMVQEPRLCIEILQQLAAAEAALNRVSLEVFRFHVDVCVPNDMAQDAGKKDQLLGELVEIFDRFTKGRI